MPRPRTTTAEADTGRALSAVVTGGLTTAGFAAAVRSIAGLDRSDPATALIATAAGLAVVLAGWFTLVALLHLGAAIPGHLGRVCRRAARTATPALLRRVVAVSVGLGSATAVLPGTSVAAAATPFAAGGTAPAPDWSNESAPDAPPTPDLRPTLEPDAVPSPGWTPQRPRTATPPDVIGAPRSPATTEPEESSSYVVRRGDCLWDIVATHLGSSADTATIAAEVPRWHAANYPAIGSDPDLIRPGTTLTPPTHHDREAHP